MIVFGQFNPFLAVNAIVGAVLAIGSHSPFVDESCFFKNVFGPVVLIVNRSYKLLK